METEGKWVRILGFATPGGDPVWRCSICHGDKHVAGVETPYNLHHKCRKCGSINSYSWENGGEQHE